MRRFLLLGLLLVPAACSGSATTSEPADASPGGETPAADASPVEELRAHCTELLTREEKDAEVVEVQHLLISFAGTPRSSATRNKEAAEALTAELFQRVNAGEDFDGLVREHTDDSHPGIYSMTTGRTSAGVYARTGMVAAFGDTGWRLDVGEVGVAAYDKENSPFGWHIVKRTR